MSGMKFETLDELSNGLWLLGIIPQAKLSGAKAIPQAKGNEIQVSETHNKVHDRCAETCSSN